MKAVLISIQPKWVEKIANGEKTIELRKTAPKEVPFKCYIYCTNAKTIGDIILCKSEESTKLFGYNAVKGINKGFAKKEDIDLKGKVIGEFVCDTAEWMSMRDCDKVCMTLKEAVDYGKGKPLYGLHISDLKIYDKPKELSEFYKPCPTKEKGDCLSCNCLADNDYGGICTNNLTRPPQSWCYVEEL